MKLELKMKNMEAADILDSKLKEASVDVANRSKGMATLTHKRIDTRTFEIEMTMALQNRMFDYIIIRELKNTIKKADPGAKIRKIK